jgi:glycosyltransferase involved in cell wall biosynthesis
MKLLVVDHNALDPAQRVLYERIVELGGIDLRLVVPTRWCNNYRTLHFIPPSEKLSYEVAASDTLFRTRTHRLIYRSLSKHLREFQPDILYMNAEPENFQTLQAALLTDRAKTKFVFSSWRNIDHVAIGYPYKFSFLHKNIEAFVLKRAAHGIVFNPTAARLFRQHGYEHVTFIPPAVDLALFRPHESKRKQNGFVIGYVGRLVEQKGVDVLLRALALLQKDVRLMIVGEGPEREKLRTLAGELGISERAEFRPPTPQAELHHVFREMDALVLPSRTALLWREQFGRVLIEAMACGVPVIGSSSGEIPFVIGDAGLVFQEGVANELAACIKRLASDEGLQADLRERGRRRVAELFSLDVVANQHHTLFMSL